MRLRNSPRKHVRYSASVQTDNGMADGTPFDISATGCRMQSKIPLMPGSYLALHIDTPDLESPLAVEVSIVRWHKDNQFGIEFLRYAEAHRERISELIEGQEVTTVSDHAPEEELVLTAALA